MSVEGMTPYKAIFGKKPNLSEVREWGEKTWVRIKGGDKLGRHVRQGHWLGIDESSNRAWILARQVNSYSGKKLLF